ncbi:MAG: phosphoglucosamine mutase [Methanomassiliicoccales archaeon]|nr:phosphoglucosamine mutase [Methanomassiliicoccales archaeon]
MTSLFGSSGIRGLVNHEMTIDLAQAVGAAIGGQYRRVVIGKDVRTSGDMIACALSSGIMSCGGDVYDAGIVPTPTLAHATRDYDCGIMITASHNPPEYNGIKIWNPDGSSFDDDQMEDIENVVRLLKFKKVNWRSVGTKFTHEGAVESHIEIISRLVDPIAAKVVVDCGCGATSIITPRLLRELGCKVISINSHPDGFFPGRLPEPTEDQLVRLKDIVLNEHADIGIAHDGDGDRVVIIDEKGRFIGGDKLLALLTAMFGKGGVVTTIDSSMIIDELVGGKVVRTRVGDAYVSTMMKQTGIEFGGEPSGTFIFAKNSLCPDGIYAAALLVKIASENKISEIVDSLQIYPSFRGSFNFEHARRREIESRLAQEIEKVKCDNLLTMDGFRAEFSDGWFLIRLSGTEPKMRITVEARTEEALTRLKTISTEIARRCIS